RGGDGRPCSPWQQNGQGAGPSEAVRRRHFETADESYQLAVSFGARLPFRHLGQENGPEDRVQQNQRRRARLQPREVTRPAPTFSPARLRRGGRFLFGVASRQIFG